MSHSRRASLYRVAIGAALIAALALTGIARQAPAGAATLGQLNSQLGTVQSRQQHLSSSVNSLSGLISSLSSQIQLVQTREAAVRAQLVTDRADLARATVALKREQAIVLKLRRRLAWARMLLSRQLVSSYEGSQPDLVSVVLNASGFNNLLEQIAFLDRAEHQQQVVIALTRQAKREADAAAARLAKLEATDRRIAAAATLRANALQGMNELLQSRQGALQRARYAQQLALDAAQAEGQRLRVEDRPDPCPAGSRRRGCAGGGSGAVGATGAGGFPVGSAVARTVRWLGDPIRDRAVRIGRSEPAAQQRRRVGLLPDHPLDLEAVWRHRSGRVPGEQGRAGRGRLADLERRRRRVELGLRRNRRDPLIQAPTARPSVQSLASAAVAAATLRRVNRRTFRILYIVVVLFAALSIRLVYIADTPYKAINDAGTYNRLASGVARTGDYHGRRRPPHRRRRLERADGVLPAGVPLLPRGRRSDRRPPAGGKAAIEPARAAQAVLGTVTVGLIGLVAWEAFGEAIALVAMALAAAYPVFIEMSGVLMAENLLLVFELAAVWAALRRARAPATRTSGSAPPGSCSAWRR